MAKSGTTTTASTQPLPLNALIDYIANQAHPDGLKGICRERYIGKIIESGGLNTESEIINGATIAIEAYFITL